MMILRTGFSISLYLLLTILFSKNFSYSQGASCGAGITALTIGNCTTFTNNDDTPLLGTGQPRNCGSGSAHSDVWYRVVGNGQQLQIVFTSNRNTNVSVYNTCPNALAYAGGTGEAQCTAANANTQTTFNLNTTNGTTYYLRIQRTSGNNTDNQSGTICVYNNCGGATPLTVTSSCNTVSFTNNQDGTFLWDRECGSGTDKFSSVWYRFQGTGNPVSANIFSLSDNNAMVAIYPSCPTANNADDIAIACTEVTENLGSTNFPTTLNQTYYVQIMRTNGGTTGNQSGSICLFNYELSACGNPTGLLNDFCENPATLYQDPSYTFTAATAGTFTPDLNSQVNSAATTGAGSCSSVLQMHNNSWYQFTAQSTSQSFPFTYTSCQGVQGVVFEVNYNSNGCCNSFTRKSNCILQVPEITTPPATQTSTNTITATGLTPGQKYLLLIDGYLGAECNFSISGWGAVNILPVEMSLFTVIQFDDKNELMWKTESEKNNAYFEVWRSYDAENFEYLSTIEGAGNSTSPRFYAYSDYDIRFGNVYYKLKQVDFDGKTYESNMIFVNRANAQPGIVSVYPSPAKETATIDVNIESKLGGSIDIFSMNGQQVYHQFIDQKGTHQVNIAVQDFQQGVYLVKYQDEKNAMTKQLIVQ